MKRSYSPNMTSLKVQFNCAHCMLMMCRWYHFWATSSRQECSILSLCHDLGHHTCWSWTWQWGWLTISSRHQTWQNLCIYWQTSDLPVIFSFLLGYLIVPTHVYISVEGVTCAYNCSGVLPLPWHLVYCTMDVLWLILDIHSANYYFGQDVHSGHFPNYLDNLQGHYQSELGLIHYCYSFQYYWDRKSVV